MIGGSVDLAAVIGGRGTSRPPEESQLREERQPHPCAARTAPMDAKCGRRVPSSHRARPQCSPGSDAGVVERSGTHARGDPSFSVRPLRRSLRVLRRSWHFPCAGRRWPGSSPWARGDPARHGRTDHRRGRATPSGRGRGGEGRGRRARVRGAALDTPDTSSSFRISRRSPRSRPPSAELRTREYPGA